MIFESMGREGVDVIDEVVGRLIDLSLSMVIVLVLRDALHRLR